MSQLKPLVVGAAGNPARIQSGDTLDPAVLGSGIRDGTRFLRDDGTYVAIPTGGESLTVTAYRSGTNQSYNNATQTVVALNAETYDTSGCFDTSTSRFQPTVEGYYQVSGALYIESSTPTNSEVRLLKNGTLHSRIGDGPSLVANSISYADVVFLNGSTDYLEVAIYSWSATSAVVKAGRDRSSFSAVLVASSVTVKQVPPVSFNLSGSFTVPQTGTARRYFSAATSFAKATIGVATAPASTLTATIKKNGTSVGTITVAAGQNYNTNLQSISISAGDYLTVDVSGAASSDLVLTLE